MRELQASDIELIADYWLQSNPNHLVGMGVDLKKLPPRQEFVQMLATQLATPLTERQSYCTIWELDESAIGHCNVNDLEFGIQAYMHLHLWDTRHRFRGVGASLVRQSLGFFFDRLQLQDLYCEPYALNPAPNQLLAKVGFELVKEYTTAPGKISFEQPVKRWHMTRARYEALGTTPTTHEAKV